ncbi:hypothetical protein B0A53_04510 [Rhodotorula sp. CCFEE 5036]|nr:hypothetical protein B0A53_04510 [Rhodotorula sp. CCFEE 5036]
MPAMSPTMTEGSISEWKVKEGEPFAAGDVLLSVETDKAAIDVEAQDDGIMGKILVGNGAAGVPVGKLIAILAEEGDDLSSLEIPSKESTSASTASASSSTPATPSDAPTPSPATPSATPSAVHSSSHPHHDKPLLPSVLRLLVLNNIEDANVIKGTGHHGVLTKGDVLAYLGKISNPRGSLPEDKPHGNHPANYYTATPKDVQVKKPVEVQLDGPTIRRMIATGLGTAATPKPASPIAPTPSFSFDSILDDYLPPAKRSTSTPGSAVPPPTAATASGNAFDAFLGL